MNMTQTKKSINMEEVDICASFALEAQNNSQLNWNKVLEKINRERSRLGIPTLRQRCFVGIMKAGGADDGRVYYWNKKKYLKSVGYKDTVVPEAEKISVEVPQVIVPEVEKIETESSAEATEAVRLSQDAIVFLKYFINHGVNVLGAKKFFKVANPRIQKAMDELYDMQLIRVSSGIRRHKGCRYELNMKPNEIWDFYPETKGVSLWDEISHRGKKDVEQEVVDDFNPQDHILDAMVRIRTDLDKGINYTSPYIFKDILPNGGTHKQRQAIQNMLVELGYLTQGNWGFFFNDPEDVRPSKKRQEEHKEEATMTPVVIPKVEAPKNSLTEDNTTRITVNNYRSADVVYRLTYTPNGIVVDIM